MTTFMEAMQEARQANDIQKMIDLVPYLTWMGIRAEINQADEIIVEQPFREGLLGNTSIRAIHGGVTGSFLETVAILTVLRLRADSRMPKIVNQTIDYRRPGRAESIFGTARIVRDGRRVVTLDAIAWQKDEREKPIAAASSHFLL